MQVEINRQGIVVKRKNQKGFSLIEVAIVMGLSSIMALLAGMQMTYVAKEQKRVVDSGTTSGLGDLIYRRCFAINPANNPCALTGNFDADAAQTLRGTPIQLDLNWPESFPAVLADNVQTNYGTINTLRISQLECLGVLDGNREVAAVSVRMSMRTGIRPNQITKENNIGRIVVTLNGANPGACSGPRSVFAITNQQWDSIDAAACQRNGMAFSATTNRCVMPLSRLQTSLAGPCTANESAVAIEKDAGGVSRTICRTYAESHCRVSQLSVGIVKGSMRCEDVQDPATNLVTVAPVTPAPGVPAPVGPSPTLNPNPTQIVIPDPIAQPQPTSPPAPPAVCTAQQDYLNCLAICTYGNVLYNGTNCTAACGAINPNCGTVSVSPAPTSPPSNPTQPPQPTSPPIPASNCSCGPFSLANNQFCGFCERNYEPVFEPFYGGGPGRGRSQVMQYNIIEVYQCSAGNLIYRPSINWPAGQICDGGWKRW